MPHSSTEMRRTVKNEQRRPIHYQRQAREGRLIFPQCLLISFFLVFGLDSFFCLLCSMQTICETKVLPVNTLSSLAILIIRENSPQVDLTLRKVLILPGVPGLSESSLLDPGSGLFLATGPECLVRISRATQSYLRAFCKHGLSRPLHLVPSEYPFYTTKCILTSSRTVSF